MKKQLCLMLAASLLAVTLSGCSEKLPQDLGGVMRYTSRVSGNDITNTVCWDGFVLSEQFRATYDRTTGEITYGYCEDVECEGDCYLDKSKAEIVAVRDGIAYLVLTRGRDIYYCAREVLSGKITMLQQITWAERCPTAPTFLDGEYLYYSRKLLREGGNPDDADDYYAHVCRVHVDGKGKEEVLYLARDNVETLLIVADGKMYTYYQSQIWRFDLADMSSRTIFTLSSDTVSGMGQVTYLDGFLYFNTIDQQGARNIGRIDAESGEWARVVDVPIDGYEIANDAIYYARAEGRQINDPVRYPPDSEGYRSISNGPTLYACDHDGKNTRAVWTDESGLVEFGLNFTVVDGMFYGWVKRFDMEKNEWSDLFFAEIHLKSGEIIPATVVE